MKIEFHDRAGDFSSNRNESREREWKNFQRSRAAAMFERLTDEEQKNIKEEFVETMSGPRALLSRAFNRNGFKSKMVAAEFLSFLCSRLLSAPEELDLSAYEDFVQNIGT